MAKSKVVRKVVTLEVDTTQSNRGLAAEVRYQMSYASFHDDGTPSVVVRKVTVSAK